MRNILIMLMEQHFTMFGRVQRLAVMLSSCVALRLAIIGCAWIQHLINAVLHIVYKSCFVSRLIISGTIKCYITLSIGNVISPFPSLSRLLTCPGSLQIICNTSYYPPPPQLVGFRPDLNGTTGLQEPTKIVNSFGRNTYASGWKRSPVWEIQVLSKLFNFNWKSANRHGFILWYCLMLYYPQSKREKC